MTFPVSNYVPDDEQSHDSSSTSNLTTNHKNGNKASSNSLDELVNSGALIDHRNTNDLAHYHTSPANTRRRSSGQFQNQNFERDRTSLPLTNKNLQTKTSTIDDSISPTAITVDMDKFTNEQRQYNKANPWRDQYVDNNNQEYSISEFGESNPSSEHSSDSTSLDDVCFPDYREDVKISSNWPDIQVLTDFIKEEIEEAKDDLEQSVNFGTNIVHSDNEGDATESTPLIDNYKVNEVESLDSINKSFRVRPTPIQPWERSREYNPPILKESLKGRNEKEVCRFTYFREALTKTIHAPALSGLVEDKSRIYGCLDELFPKPTSKPPSLHVKRDSVSSTNHHNNHSSSNNNLTPLTKSRPETPLPPPSVNEEINVQEPFWLDVLDPTEEEMKVLSKTFGIHPLTTEDIFLGEAREKVELFKSYYFVCFTSFDVVYEKRRQRAKEQEKKLNKLQEMYENISDNGSIFESRSPIKLIKSLFQRKRRMSSFMEKQSSTSGMSRGKKVREGELSPLNMYMIVFKTGIITFHFSPTPHPINVRRRARMLKDYLTVTADWICYALIDDITDSFAPMIETIETEVNAIEDTILKMHSGEAESDDDSDDEGDHHEKNVFVWRKRSKSIVDNQSVPKLSKSASSSSGSSSSKILGWKRKGDMLRRIGECRKRVMSVIRLLASKADVIKAFSKRFNDLETSHSEIGMYLGDIQDHIVTMLQALGHYEKLLARFHSNYLAQINIDMTKVNNDTNDVLGKITILGTIVLPINVVTGLWGMNCLVPGQDYDGLAWFWGIIGCMILFSIVAYNYARRVTGL
ncbi:LOW QUALITY PROTEIN: SPAC17A2.14 putative metal ion transporter C17A12.14 [Candida maltosa Xu316]